MSYTKQNFKNGQVLDAANLIKIEEGLLNSEFQPQENLITILTIPAGSSEGMVEYQLSEGTGPYAAVIPVNSLATEAFLNGTVSTQLRDINVSTGFVTAIKSSFDPFENLPWFQDLKVEKFNYAKGSVLINIVPQEENVSYICIVAKNNSAERFLGDLLINDLSKIEQKITELETRIAALEELL